MPFLTPLLKPVEHYHVGDRRLPQRLERVARLLADGEMTQAQIARVCKTSVPSIWRLKQQPAFRARVVYLQEQAAEMAQAEAPLAYRGKRIALLDKTARKLAEDLEANDYETTIAVDKGGNAITGFDRGRVAELIKAVTVLEDLTTPRHSTIANSSTLDVSVTMTQDDAVTRVRALLSRADPGTPPAGPQGWRGVSSETESVREDGAVLEGEYEEKPTLKGEGE